MDEFPALLKVAHPELYRNNAFRVARLAVDAGPRDIARQLDRLKIMEKLGAAASATPGPLSLDIPASGDDVRAAVERLRDPESRIIEEFFWFWPMTFGESQTDPALQALIRGDSEAARSFWWERSREQNGQKGVADHNLAVLAHVRALDLELVAANGQPLDEGQVWTRDGCWMEAYGHWRELLGDNAFWQNLADRFRQLNEPQVGPDTARRLRAALPAALLSVSAQLAVRAAEGRRHDDATRHLALGAGSGFNLETIEAGFRLAGQPAWERIKLLSQTVETELESDPEHADQAARRFSAEAEPLLAVLDRAMPAKHRLREAAHDEIALLILRCQIAYANRTQDWKTSQEMLERAVTLARSASARDRLQENIEIVRQNAKALLCWFCETSAFQDGAAVKVPMYGNVTRVPVDYATHNYQTRWQQYTVNVPRCGRCRSVHRRQEGFTLLGGLAGGLIGFGVHTLVTYITGAWFVGLFVISASMILGGIFGSRWCDRRFTKGVKQLAEKISFPQIEYLKKQGWALGTKPPGE
jgi:hypothetical protein